MTEQILWWSLLLILVLSIVDVRMYKERKRKQMGMYDTVLVPCPRCGEIEQFQSKSGYCNMDVFQLNKAPLEVLADVNRHAPLQCGKCRARFLVLSGQFYRLTVEVVWGEREEHIKNGQQYVYEKKVLDG